MLTFFFPRCNKPSMSLEKGVQFDGSVTDSRGNLFYLELFLDSFDPDSYGKSDSPLPESASCNRFGTSLLIDSQCDSRKKSHNAVFSFDALPRDFTYRLKRRKRVGSDLHNIDWIELNYELFGDASEERVMYIRLCIYQDRLELSACSCYCKKKKQNESKKEEGLPW